MARRNSNGRFVIENPKSVPQANAPDQKSPTRSGDSFTGLDPFTAELVARAPLVEPAQPTIIPAAKPAPAPTSPEPTTPSAPTPLLIGSIGAVLGLSMAALVKRGFGG